MSLISINQAVVETSQNQVVIIGKWKFQKPCVWSECQNGPPYTWEIGISSWGRLVTI